MNRLPPVMTYEAALQEVDRLVDGLGMPVDPKIKSLVAALNMWGVTTMRSCEGHISRGLPYPWVTIPYSHVEQAGRLLCIPNIQFKLGWFFEPYASYVRWRPVDTTGIKPLSAMQEQADFMANFLARLVH